VSSRTPSGWMFSSNNAFMIPRWSHAELQPPV
jgi:hypothetical protein